MAVEVKRRRGTTAQHASFTGALGEVTVDTDKKTVVVHDGATAGGFPLAVTHAANTFAGIQSFSGVANFASGTVAAPSLYLNAETGSGLYRIGANNHGYAISGVKVLDISATGLGVTGTGSFSGALSPNGGITLGANYISRAGTSAGISIDASNNVTVSGALTAAAIVSGTTPATTGAFRMPSASFLSARNNANSADIRVIGMSAGQLVSIDPDAQGVIMAGGLAVTGTLSSTGTITCTSTATSNWSGLLNMTAPTGLGTIGGVVVSTTGLEWHLRPAAGKTAQLTFTEDAIADRWTIGTINADSKLYFKAGRGMAAATVATLDSTGLAVTGTLSATSTFNADGGAWFGTAALATGATTGHVYIQTSAGAPTGIPAAKTGQVAIQFDTTNNKLYIYDGGWLSTAALT